MTCPDLNDLYLGYIIFDLDVFNKWHNYGVSVWIKEGSPQIFENTKDNILFLKREYDADAIVTGMDENGLIYTHPNITYDMSAQEIYNHLIELSDDYVEDVGKLKIPTTYEQFASSIGAWNNFSKTDFTVVGDKVVFMYTIWTGEYE